MKATLQTLFHATVKAMGSETILVTQHIAAPNKNVARLLFIGFLGLYYSDTPINKKRISVVKDSEGDGTIFCYLDK